MKDVGGGLPALEAATGPAAALAVGRVAAFLNAVGADGLRVREFPDVRAERRVVGRAGQQLVEHVLEIGRHIQVVADRHLLATPFDETRSLRPVSQRGAGHHEPCFKYGLNLSKQYSISATSSLVNFNSETMGDEGIIDWPLTQNQSVLPFAKRLMAWAGWVSSPYRGVPCS